jgi:predicted nuclease of restriction endonuclease-like RecB superfamily
MTEEKRGSSFAVVVEPTFENDKWTGNVNVSVEEDIQKDLAQEEVDQIRSLCGMIASCLPLMEEDDEFMSYVKEYFTKNYTQLLEEIQEDGEEKTPSFTRSEDGKVITLDFATKTFGSA